MLKKTELGRLLIKLSLFIIVLLCIDLILSSVMKFAVNSYYNGENKYRAAIEEKSDVIILGASKAATDYIPSLISKNTGYSVYNLGTTGGTFLVQYAQLKAILTAYKPKLVIIEMAGFDLVESMITYRSARTVDRLLLHWDNPAIKRILLSIDHWIYFKMVLKSYRYSSIINDYIVELIRQTPKRDPYKGYTPKTYNKQIMDRILQNETGGGIANTNEPKYKRSAILVQCLDDILSLLQENEVNAIFIKSPLYNPAKSKPNLTTRHLDPVIIGAVRESGYPLRDNTYLNVIADHKTYFADGAHLNNIGSEVYSNYISAVIDSFIR